MTMQPKPFVFVLMPFDKNFNDIYKFGIKGAADEVGAYAERLDEQIFREGMLDRIFNQISKADVIIADMTGRNPNVFYEVGYAHALGKVVLLLTQSTDDIPFDLKHRQHTVYGGQIEGLRAELVTKLRWAIAESHKQQRPGGTEIFSLRVNDSEIPRSDPSAKIDKEALPRIFGRVQRRQFSVPLHIRNDSLESILGITHVYLFCERSTSIVPREIGPWDKRFGYMFVGAPLSSVEEEEAIEGSFYAHQGPMGNPERGFRASPADAPDGLDEQYRIKVQFSALPPGAVEEGAMHLVLLGDHQRFDGVYRLRLHSSAQFLDFTFRLSVIYTPPEVKRVVAKG
jgi:hypothetical protein